MINRYHPTDATTFHTQPPLFTNLKPTAKKFPLRELSVLDIRVIVDQGDRRTSANLSGTGSLNHARKTDQNDRAIVSVQKKKDDRFKHMRLRWHRAKEKAGRQ